MGDASAPFTDDLNRVSLIFALKEKNFCNEVPAPRAGEVF
jgi:hypothetical protein